MKKGIALLLALLMAFVCASALCDENGETSATFFPLAAVLKIGDDDTDTVIRAGEVGLSGFIVMIGDDSDEGDYETGIFSAVVENSAEGTKESASGTYLINLDEGYPQYLFTTMEGVEFSMGNYCPMDTGYDYMYLAYSAGEGTELCFLDVASEFGDDDNPFAAETEAALKLLQEYSAK